MYFNCIFVFLFLKNLLYLVFICRRYLMWNQGELIVFLILSERNTGNSRYIYFSTPKSWYAAQSYCRQYHTDLASTRDATEYSYIHDLVTPLTGYTWIGLTRHSWKWIDQTNFSTISWMPGKPDNALKKENCGYLSNSQAVDALCSDVMPFFCYSGKFTQLIFRPTAFRTLD